MIAPGNLELIRRKAVVIPAVYACGAMLFTGYSDASGGSPALDHESVTGGVYSLYGPGHVTFQFNGTFVGIVFRRGAGGVGRITLDGNDLGNVDFGALRAPPVNGVYWVREKMGEHYPWPGTHELRIDWVSGELHIIGVVVDGIRNVWRTSMVSPAVEEAIYRESAEKKSWSPLISETIPGGGTITRDWGAPAYTGLLVVVRATYDPAATAGIKIRWLYSADYTNFDSPEEADLLGNYFEPTFVPGATRQTSFLVPHPASSVRFQVINKDPAHPVTVTVWLVNIRPTFPTEKLTIEREFQKLLAKLDEINRIVYLDNTTTPLPANGEWVGFSYSSETFKEVFGSCYSDQSGTLYVEQATPNGEWDVQSVFPYTAGTKMGFSVEVVSPKVRLRYVNGPTAQTVFRLYSYARRL